MMLRRFRLTAWLLPLAAWPAAAEPSLPALAPRPPAAAAQASSCCFLVGYQGRDRTAVFQALAGLGPAEGSPQVDGEVAMPSSDPARDRGAFHVTLALPENWEAFVHQAENIGRYVEPDRKIFFKLLTPTDRGFRAENNPPEFVRKHPKERYQWALRRVGIEAAWDITTGSAAVDVAVLDTGLLYDHPAAGTPEVPADLTRALDFVDGTHFCLPPVPGPGIPPLCGWVDDPDGPRDLDASHHGTMVAAVIGSTASFPGGGPLPPALQDRGIAGGAVSRILPYRVLDENGCGTVFQVASGLVRAADDGAEVINLSLGAVVHSRTVEEAAEYARNDRDALLIAGAGNLGRALVTYPAAFGTVLAIGATDRKDRRARWSSYGDRLDLVAPGERVLSLAVLPKGELAYGSGTSYACAIASAAAALGRALRPDLCPGELETLLRDTAETLLAEDPRGETGAGLLDAAAFLGAVQAAPAGSVPCPVAASGPPVVFPAALVKKLGACSGPIGVIAEPISSDL